MTTSAWLNFEKFFYYAFTVELNLIISGCKKSWSNLISIHWKDCGTPEQFSWVCDAADIYFILTYLGMHKVLALIVRMMSFSQVLY